MSIEVYTTAVLYVYIGLFLLFILMGVVDIWNRIWKKKLKYWSGIIPCFIFYLISAIISTFVASIAYDDPADPNYVRYKNWELHDFILHDIKTFLIWLIIGILLYLVFKRKSAKKSIKTGFVERMCSIMSKKIIVITAIIVVLIVSFLTGQWLKSSGMGKENNSIFEATIVSPEETETISFHDKTFNKSDLSQETIEWLEWYNNLSEEEQLATSYIPADLYELCGYPTTEDAEVPAE